MTNSIKHGITREAPKFLHFCGATSWCNRPQRLNGILFRRQLRDLMYARVTESLLLWMLFRFLHRIICRFVCLGLDNIEKILQQEMAP